LFSDRGATRNESRRDRSRSPVRSSGSRIGSWKRGGTRVSNFDVLPPNGIELPPIGVVATPSGVPNSYFSYANNPAVPSPVVPPSGGGGHYGNGGGGKYPTNSFNNAPPSKVGTNK
jgi:hypothetical protein